MRVLDNEMTVVAHKLFKSNPVLHWAFILYRLKSDFGFTATEIANFTGIPESTLQGRLNIVAPFLETDVLKILSKMDKEGALKEWRELSDGRGGMQGYYVVKEGEPWYEKYDEKTKERVLNRRMDWSVDLELKGKLGNESLKEQKELLERAKAQYDRLKAIFEQDPALEELLSEGSSRKLQEPELPKELREHWELEKLQ